ncbi:MAG: hypothetical protein KUG83_07550 [Gammaproteobacteria bacterium]|nr:hypothetical protein [Gammaproteobacteria bacterium]
MKWIFVCLMMLNVLYFTWHHFVAAEPSGVALSEQAAQNRDQKTKALTLVSEGRPGS